MATKKKKNSKGQWIDTIYDSTDKFIRLETFDGVQREGRLSGFRTRKMKFNGEDVELIFELEMNGDPTDLVEFHRIQTLVIE